MANAGTRLNMPKRTHSHIVADQAVSRVTAIVNDCGFSCDAVHHDYGEDLFVQTHLASEVDPFRIWIQVKGAADANRLRAKDGTLQVRVSFEHAYKWIRSNDLIVAVVWDVRTDRGWWSLPSLEIDEWPLWIFPDKKTIAIKFNEQSEFHANAMRRLSWIARIQHYSVLFARAIVDERGLDASGQKVATADLLIERGYIAQRLGRGTVEDQELEPRLATEALIAIDFLRRVGFLKGDEIDDDLLRLCMNGLINIGADYPDEDKSAILRMSAYLSTMASFEKVADGVGLPILICDRCSEVISRIIESRIDITSARFAPKASVDLQ